MKKYKLINQCRSCKNKNIQSILSIGNFYISSWLSTKEQKKIIKSPLELVKCSKCNLVQLKHTVSKNVLYNKDYGYRSGTNATMNLHLQDLVRDTLKKIDLKKNDYVLDIGCNDGTLLSFYKKNINKIGIDPIANKIKKKRLPNVKFINNFFDYNTYNSIKNIQKPNIITSISMFYDLDNPMKFVENIKKILAKNGIWVLEQSYLPTMIKKNSFDTICHEHLEYYSLDQINFLTRKNNLKIVDVSKNDINGGSFRIFITHSEARIKIFNNKILKFYKDEKKLEISKLSTYKKFYKKIVSLKKSTNKFIENEIKKNKKIFIYGASTKGNTILQFYNLSSKQIKFAAERNPNKYNKIIPGTGIKIISEKKARNMKPDYFFVLPWHFKNEIIRREKNFMKNGGKLIFPLPFLQIVKL